MNLYNLTGQFLNIQNMITDGVDPEVIQDTLEAVEEAIEQKALNTAYIIKSIEGNVETIKIEEKRLAARRRTLENNAKNLYSFLEQSLKAAEMDEVKNETLTLKFRTNAPSLDIAEGAQIPQMYYKSVEPSLDRKQLLDAVKKGIQIEGVTTKRTKTLQIK
ncbi:siphovirus Gp157 family protein [Bacillus cereus]|uniref:siphovirus Gp157 family protein n=1 Tax=Bacillus cereus TaxID=1396 RepID=UPI000BE497BF|nr:siphovirus Gp157 family protein [Bacillus cereus]ATI60407.1 ATPase [Bacillus cereus]